MKRKNIFYGILVLFLVGASIGYYLFQKKTPDASAYRTDEVVTATDLFAAYETDEPSANNKYLGKTLEVSGEIKSVENNTETPTATIYLEAGGLLGGVACELAKDQLPTTLSSGQTIAIKGICSGLLMDVVLNRCVILNHPTK